MWGEASTIPFSFAIYAEDADVEYSRQKAARGGRERGAVGGGGMERGRLINPHPSKETY